MNCLSSGRRALAPILLCLATLASGCASHHTSALDAAALYRAGQAASLKHDYPNAEIDFALALQGASDSDRACWAQYQLACCFRAQGKYSRARTEMEYLVRHYPSHYLAARAQADIDALAGKKPIQPRVARLDVDCGPQCLAYALQHTFGQRVSEAELRKLAGTDEHGTTLFGLKQAAEAEGLQAEGLKVDLNYLRNAPVPMILWVRRSHYVLVSDRSFRLVSPFYSLAVYDPTTGREESVDPEKLAEEWDGYLLALSRPVRLASRSEQKQQGRHQG